MHTLSGVAAYTDWSLFFLRAVVALVFGASGFNHLKSPKERAASIGMSVGFTVFLGTAESAGALGLLAGVLTRWAALGLIMLMLGAIYKKIFEWKTGFWGEKSQGWNYEVTIIGMLLVIFTSGGGALSIVKP